MLTLDQIRQSLRAMEIGATVVLDGIPVWRLAAARWAVCSLVSEMAEDTAVMAVNNHAAEKHLVRQPPHRLICGDRSWQSGKNSSVRLN